MFAGIGSHTAMLPPLFVPSFPLSLSSLAAASASSAPTRLRLPASTCDHFDAPSSCARSPHAPIAVETYAAPEEEVETVEQLKAALAISPPPAAPAAARGSD